MITVNWQCDLKGQPCGFTMEGHAGYAEEGSDIVCAAVSALAQTALLGLLHYVPQDVSYEMDEGFLSVHIRNSGAEQTVILQTMKLGLDQIAAQYREYMVLHTLTSGGERNV
ncbi:ribosomal-processing cysteine protease Prp [uncultured Megasphaera sp.]|uniref:ribosomal-processing cysteine protease Prp n=1 Tax=uncultured Megasphaera sp. TaxID=165188 RepID=UPI002658656A|nr:ribosomal-processing cysteine protease Prp [uncultured Megasphaera sp.]